jgi:undecaprenyl-diphosphatase
MGILEAIILGAVQGITEFWPISSSAHTALLIHLGGWGEPNLSFLVALHVGSWLAVVWYYRRRLLTMIAAWWREVTGKERGNQDARLTWLLILATIPGALLGAIFAESSEMMESMPLLMTIMLAVFGLVLWAADAWGNDTRTWKTAGWREALAIGVAQAMALVPGVSRSGASISAARAAGIERKEAADFAFLLSVPIIGAAGAYEGLKMITQGIPQGMAWGMLAGGIAAALTGYFAINFLLTRLKRGTFRPYAIYRLVLAVVLLIVLVLI